MKICEFCSGYQTDGRCWIGLDIPMRMGCREFTPGLQQFCSNPDDFVSASQITQMATFFGIKGMELKKVKLMAAREEETRSKVAAVQTDSLITNE